MSETSSSSGGGSPGRDGEEGGPRPEKILKRRNKKGKLEYLIRWRDGGVKANSWVAHDTVKQYPPELMNDFESPWIRQGERELLAREEGRKNRMEEEGSEGQSQEQSMPAPPHPAGRPKKKSKTCMEPSGSGSTSTPSTSAWMEQYLLNPVILTNLFKVCPKGLLASCRLVCKTWHRDSLVTWRSSSSLIILHRLGEKDEIYLAKKDLNPVKTDSKNEDLERPSKTSLPAFLAYLKQECGTQPYRQFHLSNWSLTPPAPPTSETSPRDIEIIQGQQGRFWELAGGSMTYLKLSECIFQDASAFRKIIFQACPNLKTLILHKCSSVGKTEELTATQYQAPAYGEQVNLKSMSVRRDGDQRLPLSYLEILSHFPSLTSLDLAYNSKMLYRYNADTEMADLNLWIDAIKVIRQNDGDKLALGRFGLSPGFKVGHSTDPAKCRELCRLFQEMNLCPELLFVELHCEVADVLKDFLTLSGKSIRKIRALKRGGMGGCCGGRPTPSCKGFPCNFPFGVELDNLQVLTLSANFCHDMEFLKWTPNLVTLRLLKNDRELGHHGATPDDKLVLNTSEAAMTNVKLLKLKELWMGYRLYDVEKTAKLCGWMPNLEIATMFLDDEQFGVICENWRKLRHIHVLGSRLGDKGITGMGFKGDRGRDSLGVAVVRPNITLLNDLNCFQFAILDSKLSDASVYNGFLKLPNLQILEIASNKSNIGDEAMKALHEKVPQCQIIGSPAMRGRRRYGAGPEIRKRNIRCDHFH